MTVDIRSERPVTALAADVWQLMIDFADDLDDERLLLPTRCHGWSVVDLLFHLLIDAQRILATLASPADGPADTDVISYWAREAPGLPSFDHAQFIRRGALAYARPSGLKRHWRDISLGAMRAVARADEEALVQTPEGDVMYVHDVAAGSVVELTIHYLDITMVFDRVTPPPDDALRLIGVTLDELLGAPVDADWDDLTYALKGSGRVPLTDAERADLGNQAHAFPLLG